MNLKGMTLKDWATALALAVLAMIVNVAMSFIWVWAYSQIEPGQTEAAYMAYAEKWAPVSSVVFGAPILFVAGWLAGRRREPAQAALIGLMVAVIYVAIDLAMVVAVQAQGGIWLWVALSWSTKLLFAWLGGRAGAKRA